MAQMDSTYNLESEANLTAFMDEAQRLYRSGDLPGAESICRRILATWPGQGAALHLAGIVAHRSGRLSDAVGLLQQALEKQPSDLNIIKNLILILCGQGQINAAASYCSQALSTGSANYRIYQGLGDLFCSHGYFSDAANLYEKALSIKADIAPAWINLGNALVRMGRPDDAIACYQNALPLDPGNAEIYYNLGNVFSAMEMFADAIANYEKSLVLQPDHSPTLYNMGNALKAERQFDAAVACYQKCIHHDHKDIDAHYNLANALYAKGQVQAAVKAYEETLRIAPNHVFALNNLGCLLKDLGSEAQAVALFERSIDLDPTCATAYVNLGNAHKDRHDFEKAYDLFSKALGIAPQNLDALVGMGRLLRKEGNFDEGMQYLKQAVDQSPKISNAWWYYYLALPILYASESEIVRHRQRFAEQMDQLIHAVRLETPASRKRALSGIGSLTNFYLQYQGQNDRDLQARYGRFVHQVMGANFPQYDVARPMPTLNADGRIRIGYVSSFMRAHTVGHFLRGWLENHDRSAFKVHCYYIDRPTDALTERFKQISDRFYQIPGSIETAARQISEDDLHILVYTDVGMFPPATQLAGLRLAPIQCKGWGHPVTTGLPTIDYYLSSDLMETADADAHYSETLVRLPNLALAFKKPEIPQDGKNRQAFGMSANDFVFLTSQSLFKYLPQFDDIYPRIASTVGNAKFVFISNPSKGVTRRFRKRLEKAFDAHHLTMDRFCIFQPRLSPDDFLRLNRESDVLLDPLSWSGGKTTLEGISCGLPVVTCPGTFMRARHAYAMLKMMGITETIADDKESYIAIAAQLGTDPDFYERMRTAIGERRHRLYDDRSCIRELESFYIKSVKARLSGQGQDSHEKSCTGWHGH